MIIFEEFRTRSSPQPCERPPKQYVSHFSGNSVDRQFSTKFHRCDAT